MAAVTATKKTSTAEEAIVHKIRITLSSRDVTNLESVSSTLVSKAKEKSLTFSGPIRLPTKNLKLTVRKSPCGEGTNTWDRYEMTIHKRLIDLESPAEMVKQITTIPIKEGVDVEVTIIDQ